MPQRAELLAAPKTERYRILSFLGRGGTSLVYKALDLDKNLTVALKSIRFPGNNEIYRIKQEFRFFQDFYHQNLVMLYDLHVTDDTCFYTMELVEGVDFVAFAGADERRLRVAFAQLVEALSAVHDAGRLHRDLKPGNVLVEPSERTVLLDFGLAAMAASGGSLQNETEIFGGTPAYMAPEQVRGEPASAASDLYAMGVMLYQTLTGRLPYLETSAVARHEAQRNLPPPPGALRRQAPADLGELALALLAFDPAARPPLADLKRLLTRGPRNAVERAPVLSSSGAPFVGRSEELAKLDGAWARVLAGERVSALVSGVSGVGKTALIERFLARTRERDGALVIRSRCHPQESVRYNALDGLIDHLSRHLVTESPERLAAIAPEELPALLTMFPVLGRVAWPPSEVEPDLPTDPRGLARAGMRALSKLLGSVAAGRPLALWIDDLQWSDASSVPLLDGLAAAGEGRPIFPIFSYLSNVGLPESLAEAFQTGRAGEVLNLVVEPLPAKDISELMQALVGEDSRELREAVETSGGLPFFAIQLAADLRGGEDGRPSDGASATALLARRLRALPAEQPAVLEVVSVAARPMREEMLVRILARLTASARDVYRLLKQHLLRRADAQGRPAVEASHDMIRVSVLQGLAEPARRARHRDIAEVFALEPEQDHALLAEHYLGAGDARAASEHAISAARAARKRLLFLQAVEFLELAARLRDPLEDGAALTVELAEALAEAGRSSEAADQFLRAAAANEAEPKRAAPLIDRAAQQMLYSGRLVEGHAAYRKLFTDLGVAFPATAREALRMSLVNRVWFALRLTRRPPGDATARLDSLWAAAKGFLILDYVVGDAIFTRFLREAAAAGETSALTRALGLEAAVMANIGRGWSFRRAERLLARAQALAGDSQDPYDRMALATCRIGIVWHRGQWTQAATLARETLALHRRERVRYDFERTIVQSYLSSSLVLSGAIREGKAHTLEVIEDARARGDVYVSRFFRSSYYVYIALAEDDAETIIAESDEMLRDLPSDRFTSLHWAHFLATVNALAYAGRAWDAWALVQRQWPAISEVRFPQLGMIGLHVRELRARAALAAASAGGPPPSLAAWTPARLLRVAEEDVARIERLRALACAPAIAAALRSGIARRRGDANVRRSWLAEAAQGFAAADMALHRASAELQSDDAAVRRAALAAMEQAGVKRPDRLSAFLTFAL